MEGDDWASNDASQASGIEHDYHKTDPFFTAPESVDIETTENTLFDRSVHTPLKNPNPAKKSRTKTSPEANGDISNQVLFNAIQSLSRKFDTQNDTFQAFELQLRENTEAVVKIRQSVDLFSATLAGVGKDVTTLQKKMGRLEKENAALRESCLEHARYKRRWSLLLNGVPEKENEEIREEVIGILSKVVPLSIPQLQATVDTVHRLGQRKSGGKFSSRQTIIQFGMRVVRDQVWKLSKDAEICNQMKIRFREDLCKEDRDAHERLWPKVEAARKKGLKAYLRNGHAVINGVVVLDPGPEDTDNNG